MDKNHFHVEIQLLEEGMWTYEKRSNGFWLDQHLHPEFTEAGRSGQLYKRHDFFPVAMKYFEAVIPLKRFRTQRIAIDCVLATYDSTFKRQLEIEYAHRSSIWVTHEGRWQLLYHQGTPFNPD